MESYTGYLYREDACYKKKDGLGDDKSRTCTGGRSMFATEPHKDSQLVKNNSSRLNRFRKLIYNNVEFPEPKRHAWKACDLCGCVRKVLLQKKQESKHLALVTDCFNRSSNVMINHPRMQQRFDLWMEEIRHHPTFDPHKSDVPKPKRIEPPKHRCKHDPSSFIRDYKESESKDVLKSSHLRETVVRCAFCPEPYRPWIRNAKADHTFKSCLFHRPNEKACLNIKSSWLQPKDPMREHLTSTYGFFQRITSKSIQDPYELKYRLKMILKEGTTI
ncbi:uncharacterized protein [Halyomorpha halys]|uniref:uncharacterized protein isoform X2 n=1 Tax=Halyomorpha halys TaxID=286706 RepID=UPI0006D4F16B|nr:uncharacterized protein LOC106685642 isoform X2 [Halyomorpha halys]